MTDKCRLTERVQTTEAWMAEHRPHLQAMDAGEPGGPPFDFIKEDAGHPSGDWVRLCCPCGARHTTDNAN